MERCRITDTGTVKGGEPVFVLGGAAGEGGVPLKHKRDGSHALQLFQLEVHRQLSTGLNRSRGLDRGECKFVI